MHAIIIIIYLALLILQVAAFWRIFSKAGKPGWACIIPLYNIYILLQIAGKPGWWLLLMFVPLVNLVVGIIVYVAIADCFGKSTAFAIGLVLMPIVFFPILAFSDAQYTG